MLYPIELRTPWVFYGKFWLRAHFGLGGMLFYPDAASEDARRTAGGTPALLFRKK
jgi:hypothetical protein